MSVRVQTVAAHSKVAVAAMGKHVTNTVINYTSITVYVTLGNRLNPRISIRKVKVTPTRNLWSFGLSLP